MRKVILALVMALCLASTFVVGASAHTVSSPHKVHPRSTGGGCGGFQNSREGDISASSCINFDGFSGNLNGDVYVTFRIITPYGYVSGCYVQIVIISNHGQYPGLLNQNCVIAASNDGTDVHFGTLTTNAWQFGDFANTVVNIKLTYSAGHVSADNLVTSKRIYL